MNDIVYPQINNFSRDPQIETLLFEIISRDKPGVLMRGIAKKISIRG